MKVEFQVLQNSCSPHTPPLDVSWIVLVFGAKKVCDLWWTLKWNIWQIPRRNIPKWQLPKWKTPQWQIPKRNIPKWQLPKWNTPKWQIPKRNIPKWQIPKSNTPKWLIPKWNNYKWQILSESNQKITKMATIGVETFGDNALRKLYLDLTQKDDWDDDCELCLHCCIVVLLVREYTEHVQGERN